MEQVALLVHRIRDIHDDLLEGGFHRPVHQVEHEDLPGSAHLHLGQKPLLIPS